MKTSEKAAPMTLMCGPKIRTNCRKGCCRSNVMPANDKDVQMEACDGGSDQQWIVTQLVGIMGSNQ